MKPHNFTNDYAMERGTLAMMRGFSYSWYSLALMTIVVTGIIFNTLALTVLWSRRLSSVSTVSYLSALALFDTLALLVNMGGCIVKYVDFFSVFSRTVWWCRATYIVSTTVYTCASWIVVMVAIERMLIVAYPHKAEAILNVAGKPMIVPTFICMPCFFLPRLGSVVLYSMFCFVYRTTAQWFEMM